MYRPCITIDVEDWLQSTWDRTLPISNFAAQNTLKLLDLLDELSIKTTMFILGKFAETFPKIVKEIHTRGHEIASHGYGHIEIFNQTVREFRQDIILAKNILENLTSKKIIGYRAPDFSITKNSLWAFEVLSEAGYEYDSSVYPISYSRYGIKNFSITPLKILLSNKCTITEYPIAVFRFLEKNFPIGGGGYHRLLPGFITRFFACQIIKNRPFILYCHPYEFNNKEFSTMNVNIPLSTKIHQGMGRKYFESRFKTFVTSFGSQKISDLHVNSEWELSEVDNIFR